MPIIAGDIRTRSLTDWCSGSQVREPETRESRIQYINNLLQDSEMDNTQELSTLMEDRVEWKKVVAHRPYRAP